MPTKSATSAAGVLLGLLIVTVIVAAVIVSIISLARIDVSGDRGSGLSGSFELDIDRLTRVDPQLIHYRQTEELSLELKEVRAIAVGPDDAVYVAGDKQVDVLDQGGRPIREVELALEPTCLAVGGREHVHPGRLYVGAANRIATFTADGAANGGWAEPAGRPAFTSIALAENDVFVADAGNRVVWRYDVRGKLLGKIGEPDPDRGVRGFVIPSPCFDVAVTHEPLLRVVNPGARRVEAYTFDGDPMVVAQWGQAGPRIDQFFGCCNPAQLCLLADDRFVTAEKGVPRVKVYDINGNFESVVAAPAQLAPTDTIAVETRSEHRLPVFDVAADSRGRILVLDPRRRSVRVFERKEDHQPAS
jgi:hypothetical protein